MKYLLTTLAFLALSLTSQEALASEVAQKSAGDQAVLRAQFGEMRMIASEFVTLTPKEIAKKTGKKMSWGEKILFKITQKRVKKQLAKGIQPPPAEGGAAGLSKKGIASVILSGLGVLFLILLIFSSAPAYLFLCLICGILGLILGIIGLIKDENNVAAIIGTASSALVLFFLVLAFMALAG